MFVLVFLVISTITEPLVARLAVVRKVTGVDLSMSSKTALCRELFSALRALQFLDNLRKVPVRLHWLSLLDLCKNMLSSRSFFIRTGA